ncbi:MULTISPECIES: ImmA/IrrE family metallo-endopeptidase [unclassified Pseudomonas]|uniref:ImmA/IrrE family metallo-endopeptidase n=1 Tax=unclassified Pseudomonas TaxID=196821 RepID=UPI000CD26B95|nr:MULTISPECIES: ImmA/IrrE family metallo-endopeptidase [unclassified Pseudomonas]POA27736.1 toxin [Pseudomonas sp. FW305-3-2-15-E-TSA4]POA45258.1 toxin [Pseudomonas sp. FW305-3-2-15-E-TSA2]
MPGPEVWTPQKAAIRLTKICDQISMAHGIDRFPMDVAQLALGTAEVFKWPDPIAKVESVDIKGFDGALFANEARSRWMLLYNSSLASSGRIRFTQAHELGHYILHRLKRDEFKCSSDDMLSWEEKNIEAEADLFASFLLMPLNDFRNQLTTSVDFELLRHCAIRYGVSLTATALKWIQCTEESAVLILSRDGFMKWAFSSATARRNGAFFRTRQAAVGIPPGSLAAASSIAHERHGVELPASVWFAHADRSASVREMKIQSEKYEYTMTLLCLARNASVWPPFSDREDESGRWNRDR